MCRSHRGGRWPRAHRLCVRSRAVGNVIEQLERRVLLAAVSRDGEAGTGNWHDPLNWSGDVVPGPADDVTISVAANPTVRITSGTQSIKSLRSDEALVLSGGTLQLLA